MGIFFAGLFENFALVLNNYYWLVNSLLLDLSLEGIENMARKQIEKWIEKSHKAHCESFCPVQNV